MSTSTLQEVLEESQGVIVQFPDWESAKKAIPDSSSLYTGENCLGDSLTYWFKEPEFNELAPYWNENFQIQKWHFHFADHVEEKKWKIKDEIHWSEILFAHPKLWIDDIIRAKMVTMVYQPIVIWNGNAFRLHSHEILTRGYISNGQVILPDLLFEEAKHRGMLYQLDRLCRIEALRASHRCPVNTKIFINFSPSSIFSPTKCLHSTFAEAKRLSIDPNRIVFEVVESDHIDDLSRLHAILDHIHERGYAYALDDVGQGANNMERIEELRPDYVKLDRHFVSRIDSNKYKQDCAKRIFEMADRVHATCIAEGVEREEESAYLRANGYLIQQGYLFGKPGPMPYTDTH